MYNSYQTTYFNTLYDIRYCGICNNIVSPSCVNHCIQCKQVICYDQGCNDKWWCNICLNQTMNNRINIIYDIESLEESNENDYIIYNNESNVNYTVYKLDNNTYNNKDTYLSKFYNCNICAMIYNLYIFIMKKIYY